MFVTPAMHAYAHQWACQIVFNPRLKKGLGLTDGEGVERLWSRLRFLIAVTRSCAVRDAEGAVEAMLMPSQRRRRLFMIDRRVIHLQAATRDELGRWAVHRQAAMIKKLSEAKLDVAKSGRSPEYLREQWEIQRMAQLSIRKRTPSSLRLHAPPSTSL